VCLQVTPTVPVSRVRCQICRGAGGMVMSMAIWADAQHALKLSAAPQSESNVMLIAGRHAATNEYCDCKGTL
jgi:hypothetical protein